MNSSQSRATTTVWRSVHEIDAAAWNSVRHDDDLFMDLRLLQVLASTLGDQTELWFVLIRDPHGEPVAIACLYTFTPDAFMMAEDCWSIRVQKQIQKVLPGLFAHKVLACGMPLSAAQNYLRIAPTANHAEVLKTLDQLLLQLGRTVGAKYVMLKEFSDDEVACQEHLPTLGYQRADSLPQNIVHPQHTCLEEHIKFALKHGDRRPVRRILRKANADGIAVRFTSDPDEVEQLLTRDVHALYSAVFAKAQRKLEWLPIEFFHEFARQLPDNCCHCFLLKDDKVLAFGINIFTSTHYYPLFLGINYERNQEFGLYFHILLAELADGLSRRPRVIEMGQTSDYVKRHKLGCHPSRRYLFVKGTSQLMHWLMLAQFNKTFPPQRLLD